MPFLTKVGSAAARAYGLLSAAVAAVPDVYFYLVSMLLPGTGTNGAQNNTFLDSSSNNFTVTRNGNTTQGTFSPFSQTGWSNYFDGAGDYLNITVSMSITGDFTWESWGYDTGVNGFGTLMGWRVGTPWTGFLIQRINATNVQCDISQTSLVLTQTSGTYAKNAWVHVALVRSGSTITLYVNGTSVASGTLAGTITTGTAYWIGSDNLNNVTAAQYSGWISNQRFVNGTAVYTANFTPPTAPLTAITNTSLLTCNSQSFVDTGPNNFTITVNGNTAVTANSPFAPSLSTPTSYSGRFDGSGDYVTAPSNAAFGYGTGNFTIEFWLLLSSTALQTLVSNLTSDSSTNPHVYLASNGSVRYYTANADRITGAVLTTNRWYHIAVARSGTSTKLFVDGVQSGSTYTDSNDYGSTAPLGIGTYFSAGTPVTTNTLNGYISNLRIVKGTAVYTSNFTPPTAPLTAIANTSLLTCQNATFIDNSTNAFALTVNGNTRPRTLNPFGYTTTQPVAWSASLNGGAGYFDGTGDSLTVAGNVALAFGTGDFTVEFWVYINSGTSAGFWDTRNTAIQVTPLIYYDASVLRYYVNGVSVISGGALTASAWAHIALTRASGTTRLFVNGSQVGSSYADTNNYTVTNTNYIGNTFTSGLGLAGSISDFRVVKGTAVYTANFTPPTAPLTAITNTSLLLNYTNAGIYDAASQNALETVGNAQISTAQSKWGGGSMYFDGTGDYLIPSNTLPLTLGTGDFTIEFWVYFTVGTTASRGLIDWRPASTEGVYPAILTNASSAIIFYVSSATRITGGTLSAATWTHIAVCRSVTSTRLFINGTQSGSTYTDSNNYLGPALRPMIGATGFSSGGSAFDGYMDDLRITRFARYTANFTPPAAAFSLR